MPPRRRRIIRQPHRDHYEITFIDGNTAAIHGNATPEQLAKSGRILLHQKITRPCLYA
jgi:hypothetical protein